MTKDIFSDYINSVTVKYSYDETTEMGYRADFEMLLKGIFESVNIRRFDHDAKAKEGNRPDFVVKKGDIPVLYIETKDIGTSLDKIEKSEQMSRYFGYANLVLTDYVEFRFYRNGLSYGEPIKIAQYEKSAHRITPFPNNYEYLAKTLVDFSQSHKEPIRSGKHLAKIMGGKGQRIRDNIREIFVLQQAKSTELMSVYETLKKLLVHDLTVDAFADMYAQTLVYGLFVARFYDTSLESFSRQEARELIPASNPFLGHFFDHISGRSFEKRLSYIVDELCEVFSHANVADLMQKHFEVSTKKGIQRGQDQVIHFYEDFLKEYDDELRKKMGAYYTPLPVVQFIVRSIDYLLEKEFNLVGGLANTSKTVSGVHKVQILDPAVGTGTFISDVIGKIYARMLQSGQKGRWPSYVHHDLLPRLYGFELMMAPYTIAHLKLSLALKETGFFYFNETRAGKARLGIYLTNSLEEVNNQPELLAFDFGASIAEEAKEASKIKNERPIMVVVGNPPYSVSSSNKGEWITNLTKAYKESLNERNIQPLSDDYIKFIRFAEHFIEKNGTGIVAMITNNSFLDGIIHRQMRKHLLETFDDIYVLDLHGNSKKKETTSNGEIDENVFDIQQGVSINIFIRKIEKKSGLGAIHHSELFGTREVKFDYLNSTNFEEIKWTTLDYDKSYYFFVPKDFRLESEYSKGFKIDELFTINTSGIKTHHDSELVNFQPFEADTNQSYLYRPFDIRYVDYDLKKVVRPRYSVAKNMLLDNLSIITTRQLSTYNFQHALVSKNIADMCSISLQTKETGYMFPLYIYLDSGSRSPNLNKDILQKMVSIVGTVSPEDIFDYVYASLYSPNYRDKYKEFLKIDFPRIPYPKDATVFHKLVAFGSELRQLHLFESSKANSYTTNYLVAGSDTVERTIYEDGSVYINNTQCFGGVSKIAWELYIGGYQPAQKWLKDRKGRILTNTEIDHYQKIITILTETHKIMQLLKDMS